MFTTFILPIICAVVASFVIGTIWYSPVFFSKVWQKEMGMTKESKMPKMIKSFSINILGDVFLGFVLFTFAIFLGAFTFKQIFTLGFLLFLGGMVPILLGDVAWGSKSWKLLLVNAGYRIVSIAGMALTFHLFIK